MKKIPGIAETAALAILIEMIELVERHGKQTTSVCEFLEILGPRHSTRPSSDSFLINSALRHKSFPHLLSVF